MLSLIADMYGIPQVGVKVTLLLSFGKVRAFLLFSILIN